MYLVNLSKVYMTNERTKISWVILSHENMRELNCLFFYFHQWDNY